MLAGFPTLCRLVQGLISMFLPQTDITAATKALAKPEIRVISEAGKGRPARMKVSGLREDHEGVLDKERRLCQERSCPGAVRGAPPALSYQREGKPGMRD